VVPALVFVAIVGGLAALLLLRSQPEQEVRRLIDRQIKLATAGRTKPLWDTLWETARAACPYASFATAQSLLPPDFWQLIEYRDIRIRVDGDRAVVTYTVTYNGRPILRATPDHPDRYIRSPKTTYRDLPPVQERLAQLDRQLEQGLITSPEDYRRRRQAILTGPTRTTVFVEGQWYDDLDEHVRCG
jgi:hypothetical protein